MQRAKKRKGILVPPGVVIAWFVVDVISYSLGGPSLVTSMLADAFWHETANATMELRRTAMTITNRDSLNFHAPTITIYCGNHSWSCRPLDIPAVSGDPEPVRLPLTEFTDKDGNRFRPDEKIPQRAVLGSV